jgi:ribonuclease D
MIDIPEALERLARSLSAASVIALDCEGDGYYRYRARLCTLQTAHATEVAIVDTLALPDRRALIEVLGPRGPEKILHDCAFDTRLLASEGIELAHVFDTAVAARFLSEVSTGLSSLLEKYLGVHITKELQQADWGKRPLDSRELEYLEQDVRHLIPLAEALRERCLELDILDEVQTESAWAAESGGAPPPSSGPPWLRVKGVGELREGKQRSIVRELAALRESLAERENVPPFRVFANQLLLAMAKRATHPHADIARCASLAQRPEHETAIANAIERGLEQRDVPPGELAILFPAPPPGPERELRKRREARLIAWRKQEAAQREVNLHVVLPGHCLRDLAEHPPRDPSELRAIAGFGEKRLERYGSKLLELLASA